MTPQHTHLYSRPRSDGEQLGGVLAVIVMQEQLLLGLVLVAARSASYLQFARGGGSAPEETQEWPLPS